MPFQPKILSQHLPCAYFGERLQHIRQNGMRFPAHPDGLAPGVPVGPHQFNPAYGAHRVQTQPGLLEVPDRIVQSMKTGLYWMTMG